MNVRERNHFSRALLFCIMYFLLYIPLLCLDIQDQDLDIFYSLFNACLCFFSVWVYIYIYSNKSSHRTPLRLPSLGLYLRATTKKNLLEYNRKIISTYYDIIGHIIRLMKKTCEMKKVALVHLVGSICAFPCNITLFFYAK